MLRAITSHKNREHLVGRFHSEAFTIWSASHYFHFVSVSSTNASTAETNCWFIPIYVLLTYWLAITVKAFAAGNIIIGNWCEDLCKHIKRAVGWCVMWNHEFYDEFIVRSIINYKMHKICVKELESGGQHQVNLSVWIRQNTEIRCRYSHPKISATGMTRHHTRL